MGFFPFQTRQKSRLTLALSPFAATAAVILMTGCRGSSSTNNLPPTITSFMASPATIVPGGTAELSGIFPILSNGNTPSGTITPGNYTVYSGTVIPVSPLVTTTYTLTVSNQTGQTVSQSTTVTVGGVVQASLGVFAGLPSGAGMVNATASAAKFTYPCGVAVDASGNTYVADTGNACIRLINPAGAVSTFAGSPGHPGSADGTGAAASFNHPDGLAVDKNGNVYVADTANGTLRLITPAGVVTTLAGKAGVAGSVNGPAASATFNQPAAVAVDASLNVYVADSANHAIRLLTPAGVVSTLAGTGVAGKADGPAVTAAFHTPMGVAVDAAGNVYVADTQNHTIRQISAGIVSTLAGTAGVAGSADGTGVKASFSGPTSLAVAASGTLFVADTGNQTVRALKAGGVVTTLAGKAGTFGDTNALGKTATFYTPRGLALDGASNLYVADADNNLIRVITPVGNVSNFAGVAGSPGWAEGTGTTVAFNNPVGLAVNAAGTLYVAEATNHIIRMVTAAGQSSTVAGTPQMAGYQDGPGAAAAFQAPSDVVLDGAGNLYVADAGNQVIRKISAGIVTTLAGTPGTAGLLDGPAATAVFNQPTVLALDPLGNVYVGDTGNGALRLISTGGVVSTVATGFKQLSGLAVDASGNVYVADAAVHALYVLASLKPSTLLAGQPGLAGSADGTALSATFDHPTRLTLDVAGNLYVTDAYNNTIRKLTPGGVVSTVVGQASVDSLIPGNLPGALSSPSGIAVAPTTGQLFICVPDAIFNVQF